jgi:hypothetical protein
MLNESEKIFSRDLFQVGLSRCLNKAQKSINVGKGAAKGVGAAMSPMLI